MTNTKMMYRRFGRTDIQAPLFTCGGMRYQHSWTKSDKPSQKSIDNVASVVERAMELGINHFDTASGYGTSEEELGYALRDIPRESFCLQSKAPLRKDTTLFLEMFDNSLRLLQTDHLDLFSLHGINNTDLYNLALKKGGCLDMALRLKKDGKIRHIGFSTHGPVDVIIDAVNTGAFDYVNLHWFYINQDNWPAVLAAKRHDMGVLIISPSDKGGMLYNPPDTLIDLTAPLSPVEFNDLFCLSRPELHTLTVGASRPGDFDAHIGAIERYDERDTLVPPILKRLDGRYRQALGDSWAATWKDGLPQWHETPGNINIPVILSLWNIATAYGMTEYARMRFNLMGNADHWFPGGKPDNLESYDFTECLQNSPNARLIPDILKDACALLSGKDVHRLGSS